MSLHLIGEIARSSLGKAHTLNRNMTVRSAVDYAIQNPGLRGFAVVDDEDHVTGFLPMGELANQSLTRIYPRLANEIEFDQIKPRIDIDSIALSPITVNFEDTINEAIRNMLQNVSSEVFVVDADNVLMGSLTIEEIFSFLKKHGMLNRI